MTLNSENGGTLCAYYSVLMFHNLHIRMDFSCCFALLDVTLSCRNNLYIQTFYMMENTSLFTPSDPFPLLFVVVGNSCQWEKKFVVSNSTVPLPEVKQEIFLIIILNSCLLAVMQLHRILYMHELFSNKSLALDFRLVQIKLTQPT